MQAAAAAATAATAAGRDAMGPAVVEEEEDAEELIEQQLEASMRRRQALAEEIQHLRTQEAVARRGPPVHAQASAQARGREQEVPSSTETPRPHSAGSASADGAGRDSTEGRAGGQKGKAEVPALRSGATTPDNVLSRAKTPDAAPSRMKPSQRPLTAGAWRSTAMLAGAPRRERAKSASPESVLNRRKIFSEADWVGFFYIHASMDNMPRADMREARLPTGSAEHAPRHAPWRMLCAARVHAVTVLRPAA
jgi:hypothetical protein